LNYPDAPTGALTNEQVQQFLQTLVDQGDISPNGNSYYPIHFSPLVTTIDNTCILQNGGVVEGFHGSFTATTPSGGTVTVVYGVLPDLSPCAGGSFTFDNLSGVASHEMIEAITDPLGGMRSPGWFDTANGNEIGDLCENSSDATTTTTDSNGKQWTVAKGWSNQRGQCYAPP
jgi:hypothetical protein